VFKGINPLPVLSKVLKYSLLLLLDDTSRRLIFASVKIYEGLLVLDSAARCSLRRLLYCKKWSDCDIPGLGVGEW
jgi:hypothetical protein